MKINTKFTPNALAASRESAEALVDMLGIKGDIQKLDICNLRPFKDHPFKPYSPIKLRELADDIAVNGVISPIIVRAQVDHYEILAGHNRVEASKMAGLTQIPAIVKNVDDETACLIMVNTNINQREELLPSEKAFAYKMRAEAMKKTVGRPSKENVSQVGTQKRSDQVLAEQTGESRNQIQRYIRLTYLIPQLLQMVDDKLLPFTVGVTFSFFSTQEQSLIFDFCLHNKISTITASQAELLKANTNEIDIELLSEIFCKKAIKEKNISIKLPISMFPSNIGKIEIDNVLAEKISHLITEYYTKKDEE